MASSKMEMIKNIRAQRAEADNKKIKAIERARLMIAEAEKAVAFEATASTNPHSMASLIETRNLIDEAILSIQSVDASLHTLLSNTQKSSELSYEFTSLVAKEMNMLSGINGVEYKINGIHARPFTNHEDLLFTDLTRIYLDDDNEEDEDEAEALRRILNGYASAPRHLNSSATQFLFDIQVQHSSSSQSIKFHSTDSLNGALPQAKESMAPSNPTSKKDWVQGRLISQVEVEEGDE